MNTLMIEIHCYYSGQGSFDRVDLHPSSANLSMLSRIATFINEIVGIYEDAGFTRIVRDTSKSPCCTKLYIDDSSVIEIKIDPIPDTFKLVDVYRTAHGDADGWYVSRVCIDDVSMSDTEHALHVVQSGLPCARSCLRQSAVC